MACRNDSEHFFFLVKNISQISASRETGGTITNQKQVYFCTFDVESTKPNLSKLRSVVL